MPEGLHGSCLMACTVAEDLLAYALASTGKSRREARRTVRRILYTEGLRGLLATAPEDLRHRVQQVERPECLELVLLQHLREAS